MTLPPLIQKHNEKVTITKLKQAYSIFAQAVELAQVKYGDINNWEGLGNEQDQADMYFERITENLTLIKDCGNPSCYNFCGNNKTYLDLKGNRTSVMPLAARQGILKNGIMFSISWARIDNSKWWGKYAAIFLDINGSRNPNTFGKDVFLFEIRDMSDNWTTYRKPYLYPSGQFLYPETCLTKDNSAGTVGTTCTSWVLKHENMDYLYCPEKLGINGPYSCKEANKLNVTKFIKKLIQ